MIPPPPPSCASGTRAVPILDDLRGHCGALLHIFLRYQRGFTVPEETLQAEETEKQIWGPGENTKNSVRVRVRDDLRSSYSPLVQGKVPDNGCDCGGQWKFLCLERNNGLYL